MHTPILFLFDIYASHNSTIATTMVCQEFLVCGTALDDMRDIIWKPVFSLFPHNFRFVYFISITPAPQRFEIVLVDLVAPMPFAYMCGAYFCFINDLPHILYIYMYKHTHIRAKQTNNTNNLCFYVRCLRMCA